MQIDGLLLWWRWAQVPALGGSGKSLYKAIENTPEIECARILVCLAHIRNEIHRDTGFDFYEHGREIQERKDAFMPAGKALWMMHRQSHPPMRKAIAIWAYTIRVQKPEDVARLCPMWRRLTSASPLVQNVHAEIGTKLNTTINIVGYDRIPNGICAQDNAP